MSKANVLLQLDSDPQPSVFDSLVAVDAGAPHLLRHGNVTPDNVIGLVHGLMFTRGPDDLRHSAIFIGGSSVAAGEALFRAVAEAFFGPLRVSVMLDANGANTTAAAAVLTAAQHLDLGSTRALILGGTGPVGTRVARLLVSQGAQVRLASRNLQRAAQACDAIRHLFPGGHLEPCLAQPGPATQELLEGVQLVVAAGAAGVQLLSRADRIRTEELRLAIDLNAVPPVGIEGVEITDRATARDGELCYGALGVGGLKMKIHKAALRRLFDSSDALLDAEEIFALGQALVAN